MERLIELRRRKGALTNPPAVGQRSPHSAQFVHAHGWLSIVIWQPEARSSLAQGIESAMFIGQAALLLGLAEWWVSY